MASLHRHWHWSWYFVGILLLLSIIYLVEVRKLERFSQVEFPTQAEMSKVVNASPYFNTMSTIDLFARGKQVSNTAYKQEYIADLMVFTDQEKAELSSLVDAVDDLAPTKHLSKLPWRFAKVASRIENGYPHTLEDVIVLPETFLAAKTPNEKKMLTLAHEKVHVFQRRHPVETAALLKALGYAEVAMPLEVKAIARNNPDISGLYHKNNMAPVQVYNSSQPKSIADSTTMYLRTTDSTLLTRAQEHLPSYITQAEHPYEMMAVTIPLVLFGQDFPGDAFFNTVKQWCKEYL